MSYVVLTYLECHLSEMLSNSCTNSSVVENFPEQSRQRPVEQGCQTHGLVKCTDTTVHKHITLLLSCVTGSQTSWRLCGRDAVDERAHRWVNHVGNG